MLSVTLKAGRDKSLIRRHPWIFSGAISKVKGQPGNGEIVNIYLSDGTLYAKGAYSSESQITIRVWTFDPFEEITPDFFNQRIRKAIGARLFPADISQNTNAYRIINSESDGLPGLIVDRYADYLVCQFLSSGVEFWKDVIVNQLKELIPVKGIYNRSDVEVRKKEGLPLSSGVLWGELPRDLVEITENACQFLVDIKDGQKTGFYLDQRDNRSIVAKYATNLNILNCFSYTGGFGVMALKNGAAHITNVDSKESAIQLSKQNFELNFSDYDSFVTHITDDVFQVLRHFRDRGQQFDMIILDPPKFVDSKTQLVKAARGYKDINLLAFKLLRDEGILVSFSCSGLMLPDLFQKIVSDAALDAGRNATILQKLNQPSDHATLLSFPEGSYLKGLICLAR